MKSRCKCGINSGFPKRSGMKVCNIYISSFPFCFTRAGTRQTLEAFLNERTTNRGFNAAISACERSLQWQAAIQLLEAEESRTPGAWKSPQTMDVSKNRGILPPKWMVKIMENPIEMDDLGVPLFFGKTHNNHPIGLVGDSYLTIFCDSYRKGAGSNINVPFRKFIQYLATLV